MSAELVQCLTLESCRAVSLHRLIYQACVKTQAHTPALAATILIFVTHSCWERAGAVSVCLASAHSSHMFSDMWELELAQGGLRSSSSQASTFTHTLQSFQCKWGRGGHLVGMFISASLLLHFKWINDKSPPSLFRVTVFSFHSRSSVCSATTSWPCSSHLWWTVTLLLPSGCPLCLHASACFQLLIWQLPPESSPTARLWGRFGFRLWSEQKGRLISALH